MKSLLNNCAVSSNKKPIIIAIDGPAGSGKSTGAYLLAKKLGFVYLDTGAMYRALTWKALQAGVNLKDKKSLSRLAKTTKITLLPRDDFPGVLVYVDGQDVSSLIRTPEINKWVSVVASIPEVRHAMVEMQRKIAQEKSVVAEGRDIGTVVFPEADVKIFLVASLEERVKRRWKELQEKKIFCTKEEVKKELQLRDKLDSERKVSPLKKAPDAFLLDNTNLSISETLEKLLQIVTSKIGYQKMHLNERNSFMV